MSAGFAVFNSCEKGVDSSKETDSDVTLDSILLDIEHSSLVVGEMFLIDVTFQPVNVTDSTIVWTSSNNDIVSVSNNGLVTATALGNATITARVGDKIAHLRLSVKDGVRVNGATIWAKYNVNTFGTFTQSSESAGKFYQWGRTTAWSTIGDVTGWNSTPQTGSFWLANNDPCPEGWRLPTRFEFDVLGQGSIPHIFTTINGVSGRLFGTEPNQFFLPAVGYREEDGKLNSISWNGFINGYYWSSTADQYPVSNSNAYAFRFDNDPEYSGIGGYGGSKLVGFCIRCVAKEYK